MDLRTVSNGVSNIVNGNVQVTVKPSNGYTMGVGRKQVPAYGPDVTGYAQIQALDNDALKLIDGLNLQGTYRAIILRGSLFGVVRPDSKGGDLVVMQDGSEWLVVKVLESWPTWTKAAILKQGGTQ